MNVVIDTSAIIAVVTNQPEKGSIIDLTTGKTLISPESLRWEIGIAFSAMFKRKRVSLNGVLQALNIFKTIPIQYVDIELSQSVKLWYELGIYAYDAYMIICSEVHRCPLMTLDTGLIAVARKRNINVLEVS